MRFIELEQGSPEWVKFRKNKIGASDVPAIMGVDPYCTTHQKWRQKVFGEETRVNSAMRRGHDLEPIARGWYCSQYVPVVPAVVQSETFPYMIASLDGIGEKHDRIVEIKCCNRRKFEQIENGIVPDEYQIQIQYQLMITQATQCDLVGFDGERGVRTEVFPDLDMQSMMQSQVRKFYETSILQFREPPLCDKDIEIRVDQEWTEYSEKWKRANQILKNAQKEEENAREELILISNRASAQGNGIKLLRSFRRGNVDYKLIPELAGVNLEPYRKVGTEFWKISDQCI